MTTVERVSNSAVWAAWADALGFITELAHKDREVRHRVGSIRVTVPAGWVRRLGGPYGVEVELPAGCYSDDTQLRLATSRAIRPDGSFDVRNFAKVELVAWQAYALGGGRSTKAAAASLSQKSREWFSNFYDAPAARYLSAGGNGAAMRIQPHVWACSNPANWRSYMPWVIKNTVTTHGHPRALIGAALHASTLAEAMVQSNLPEPSSWEDLIDRLEDLPSIIAEDHELATLWLPSWEASSKLSFSKTFAATLEETRSELRLIRGLVRTDPRTAYEEMIIASKATDDSTRGSATKTAILALALASLVTDRPAAGLADAANVLGSDTDTIGSMAGALLGATRTEGPPTQPMDGEYVRTDAKRLAAIAQGNEASTFGYPDPVRWKPPAGSLDLVGRVDHGLGLAGLGAGVPVGREWKDRGRTPTVWQWIQLGFGQSVLCRRRPEPRQLPKDLLGRLWQTDGASRPPREDDVSQEQLSAFGDSRSVRDADAGRPSHPDPHNSAEPWMVRPTIDEAFEDVRRQSFDPIVVGRYLLDFALRNDEGHAVSTAFAAMVAKAWRARRVRS
jgi:ADP-ribosylglycohydrolase